MGIQNLHDSQADEAEISTCTIVSIILTLGSRRNGSSHSPAKVQVGETSAGSTQ